MCGGRWNIETTFQEMRSHLGLESTRGWSRQTVLRMAPCLFCLCALVVIFYDTMPWSKLTPSCKTMGRQRRNHVFRHDRKRATLPMGRMDFCTGAWR